MALGGYSLGTTLRYDYEVRDEKSLFKGIPSLRAKKDMVELASHILERKAGRFDPGEFKDEYELALRKLVKRKAAGHTMERPAEPRTSKRDQPHGCSSRKCETQKGIKLPPRATQKKGGQAKSQLAYDSLFHLITAARASGVCLAPVAPPAFPK
jgi:non-homologous end joining protein Ku